jgi:hypothetical protein
MFWRRKKQPTYTNAGRDSFLETVTPIWNIQESEIKLVENGFEWLPGNHLVRVFVHEDARKLREPPGLRITVSTDYRRWVPVKDSRFIKLAGYAATSCCPTYSWVYPTGELMDAFSGIPSDLELFSAVYVDEATKNWLPEFFACMAIMQPINAEIQSGMDSFMFGDAQPAFAKGQKAAVTNDILNLAHEMIAPQGKEASAWANSDEFPDFVYAYAGHESCVALAIEEGMILMTPFGTEATTINFWTHVPHPQLGNGLLVATVLPELPGVNALDFAASLNFLESRQWTDIPQLGGWHPHAQTNRVAHSVFVPNAMFRGNLVGHLAHWALQRVEWIKRTRFKDLRDHSIYEILKRQAEPN